MNYLVFEAGSRAGFSLEMFFLYNHNRGCFLNDTLYLVDDDVSFHRIESVPAIKRICKNEAVLLLQDGARVLPCDELSRQGLKELRPFITQDKYARISDRYYDKVYMNCFLSNVLKTSSIHIPATFEADAVFIRPNTKSAGSKGVMPLENYCISEKIDIANEYVVDVINNDGFHLYAREVKLKNGYDKYIRILPYGDSLVKEVEKFVVDFNEQMPDFTNGIFHIQLCKDVKGDYYYIESSKRMSGTSIVNLFFGFNPLVLYGGCEVNETAMFERNKWYRYEDFVLGLSQIM